ncbi:helix-turn-helix domain-containing protein [Paenibacillus rhizoplanae]
MKPITRRRLLWISWQPRPICQNLTCRGFFHQETGGRLVDYLTARRLKQACRLLETTDLTVERIGRTVGFPNSSYFNQLFKRVLGLSPLQYRKGS